VITLNSDTSKIDKGEIKYTVSFDNRTSGEFTGAQVAVELPDELEFVDSKPKADKESGKDLLFEIGTIKAGADGEFVIETKVASGVSNNDKIVFTANIEYLDSGDKKIVTVADITTFAEMVNGGGGFGASVGGSLVNFFVNPFLWFVILLLVIVFVYRYFASLTKPQLEPIPIEDDFEDRIPNGNSLGA